MKVAIRNIDNFLAKTKLIRNGSRKALRKRPSILQTANVPHNLNSAQKGIPEGSIQGVLLMGSIIKAAFVQIIPVLNHRIVFPCQNRSFIVFVARGTKKITMVYA